MGIAAIPAVISLASVGLSAAGQGMAAEGQASADQFRAEQLEQYAQYGELKGAQTNAQLTRNLTLTLGNIDAVRAAARADPTSPSGAAVRDYVENTEETAKNTRVDSIMQQARMDESGAAFERQASSQALLGGDLGIAGTILGGMGGLFKSGGVGSKSVGDPTQAGGLY